jgi:hypothetical protein
MTALAPAVTKRGRSARRGLDCRVLVIVAVVAVALVTPALDTTIAN